MKIEIRKTKQDGIIQITTLDERWYAKDDKFNPSVTWIGHYSPMGIGLLKYYAEHGMDEAELLKKEAGEKGSKVHHAIEALLAGQSVTLETGFKNPETGDYEELTTEEYFSVMTFADFWATYTKEHKVQLIDTEQVAWVDPEPGETYGYAGTRDIKLRVDGKPTILDIKTSKDIYLSHELQLSALKHADPELPDIAIIQVGYKRNKAGWKLTPIEDKFPLFQAAKNFWADANPESKPKQKDYPPEIKLVIPQEEPKAETKTTKQHGKGKRSGGKAAHSPKAKARN